MKRLLMFLTTAVAVVLLLPTEASAAAPCGGVRFSKGTVATVRALPVAATFDPSTVACVRAIGQGLKARPALRTVTIAVRLPDSRRIEGGGRKIADAYTKALVAEGIRKSRISAVVPAAASGEEGSVSIAFTEKRASQPVALVEGTGGPVKAGASLDGLKPVAAGAMLPGFTWIKTGSGGRVALGLADGSRLRLAPNSLLLVGNLHLNKELRRVVELELKKGDIEAAVAPGGSGSKFEVRTKAGVAGVRGTAFRVVFDDDEKKGKGDDKKAQMRVDTFEGAVDLKNEKNPDKTVRIDAGQSAAAKGDGKVTEPRELLKAAKITEPLHGTWKRDKPLVWTKVRGASKYKVRFARDAEFTFDVRDFHVEYPSIEVPKKLSDAKWFWRVVPVDGDGFEGVPSKIYAFTPTE